MHPFFLTLHSPSVDGSDRMRVAGEAGTLREFAEEESGN
jgi:hypothetical protein